MSFQVAPIDWAKQFPILKTLMLPELAANVTIDSFFHPKAVEPLATVTRLELPAGLDERLMGRAGFLFPNVTELAVGYQDFRSLRQIWTMWPKLESLHLSVLNCNGTPIKSACDNLDGLLTGFDASQMKIVTDGNRYVVGEPQFPSITNLRCKYPELWCRLSLHISTFRVSISDLRELTIHAAPYRTYSGDSENMKWTKENAVTDISMNQALIKLTSLKYLDIAHRLHQVNSHHLSNGSRFLMKFSFLDFTSRRYGVL